MLQHHIFFDQLSKDFRMNLQLDLGSHSVFFPCDADYFSTVFVGSMNPLCVLQLDDPPQRFNTSVLKNTNNPAWDQPFIL